MSWKTLEKSGLEPTAPNRLAESLGSLGKPRKAQESLRLKFTNEPSIFVDGDLAESIKRSAYDRLGDLVP